MDFNTFIEKFPIKLNEQQKSAVKAVDGPVLLLAVPGSGKTTVLVTRLGYMIHCCGISPENILTLTYTVSATRDMRERFSHFFGDELGSRMEFRTINSLCAGIISYYGNQIGKDPFELISDEKHILGLLSAIYQDILREYPTESDLKGLRTLITYIKNMMLSEDEISDLENNGVSKLYDIYKTYCEEMRNRRKMDFDDQLIYAYNLLKGSKQLLSHFQSRYPYICVDEAQDTSKIQHKIIALLSSEKENLFMVGDEDQSIYGFRAAYPDALLSFEKDHQQPKVLLMEENFRSNANIVKAADDFIQDNIFRHPKHMKATRKAGSDVQSIPVQSRKDQYQYVMKVARSCREETAILYRDNESAIPLVDLLERENIPYRIRNAEPAFFTNRIVIDIQNIMRFAINTSDADLFEQIYYKISTYLAKPMALRVCNISRREGRSVFDIISGLEVIKPTVKSSIRKLRTHLKAMRNSPPERAIRLILSDIGYGYYLERAHLSDSKTYVMEAVAENEATIDSFLIRMDELREIFQNKESAPGCPFILSTIHSSKGLEYENVYMLDVMDGIFPVEVPDLAKDKDFANSRDFYMDMGRSKDASLSRGRDLIRSRDLTDSKDLSRDSESTADSMQTYEEERRLFYVGATRAKDNLYIFDLKNRSIFCNQFFHEESTPKTTDRPNGKPQDKTYDHPAGSRYDSSYENSYGEPAGSRYDSPYEDSYGEPTDSHYGPSYENNYGKPAGSHYVPSYESHYGSSYKSPYAKTAPPRSEAEFQAFVGRLSVGLSVSHTVYGHGTITALGDTTITVQFDTDTKIFNKRVVFQKSLLRIL